METVTASGINVTQVDVVHTTSGTNTHKIISPAGNAINEDMDDVTVSSNQSHDDHHNGDNGTNDSEMHVTINTNITTSDGNGGHGMSNEDCLEDENMDNCSDHQDQGELRSNISKKCNRMNTFAKTGGTNDDVSDEGTLIIVERDGEKEGNRDENLDVRDQGTFRAETS
jgi:hypothetical protein